MSDLIQKGFAALQAGRKLEALEIARKADGDPNAKYLEGLALRAMGESEAALGAFKVLSLTHPLVPDFPNLEGLCHGDLGEVDLAVMAFEKALSANPKYIHAAFNLGRMLAANGRLKSAVTAYRRALSIDPNHLPSRRNLAFVLDQMHEPEAAETEADAALQLSYSDPLALTVKASALIQREAYGEAAELVTKRLAKDAPPVNASLALGKKGEALEKAGEYEAAFAAWQQANQRLKAEFTPAYVNVTNGFSLQRVRELARWPGLDIAPEAGLTGPAPVFLVGFPRSGTTLMENVLAAHPDVVTSDEAALSTPLIEAAGDTPDDWVKFLDTMADNRAGLRETYWAGWKGKPVKPGQVFIDKLPLNLAYAGLLAAVFPDAKFILALRDPRDCVLSAFKQRFGMNPAMFQMLSMPGASAYYDAAMTAGMRALDRLPPAQLMQVRYEDFVADLEGQARQLTGFLGLDWSDEVMRYRDKAKARPVSTPSAPQIVQPVYESSAGRWRDYAGALEAVRGKLDPWATRFGYEA